MSGAYEVFTLERHGETATLWLDRPEARNAMGPAFWKELPLAMGEIAADDSIRAAVLAARGRDFSVGLDLKSMFGEIAGIAGGRTHRIIDEIARLQASVTSIAECPKPVIAALHGYAIGGAIDVVTACDVRYAAKGTTFSIRETRIAIVADLGTLQRLPAIVGRGHAAELAFTGEDFDADYAKEIHLVNRVFDTPEATVAAARGLAERIAANSPLAVQGTKRVLDYSADKPIEDGLRFVAAWNAAFLMSEDLREAVQAFAEKRAPKFRGR